LPEGPPPDYDGDGLRGAADHCPHEAGPPENDGCPDVDTDKDTVVDRLDPCPKDPGPPSNHGCPIPDSDGDGLTDDVDRCPQAAGPQELKGCPDRDKDGVADIDDECPDTPGPVENHGCPVYKNVTVTEQKVEISQKLLFAFGKTTILPKSFPLLLEVTKALQDHASLIVRVEGHTDSIGTAERNVALSQGRAEAVMKFLVDHGVSADRLTSKGYGMSVPIDTNDTSEGRERNRRVEFVIIDAARAPAPSDQPSPKGGQ
jgi:outer membrane protein OmpA-like peptidoglycan-associated protein